MKLNKIMKFKRYKGFLIEPNLQNFFTGRIWSREAAPFPKEKVDYYIKRGLLKVKTAIGEGPICNRCLNTNKNWFIFYQCSRCQKTCTYCRHCIQMGRMSSCTELLIWDGPAPAGQKRHKLDWKSEFTSLQKKASNELTDSIRKGKSHLIHAVCGTSNEDGTF